MTGIVRNERTVLIAIYNEAVLYPPTVSMIHMMAKRFAKVHVLEVVSANHEDDVYPENVIQHRIVRMTKSKFSKGLTLLAFVNAFRKLKNLLQPAVVLSYDPVATIPMYLFSSGGNKRRFHWYHNHDIIDEKNRKGISVLRIASFFEKWNIAKTNLFTIPSVERFNYYKIDRNDPRYQVLPNFPSLHFFDQLPLPDPPVSEIVLLYQGNISEGHGIEELLSWLPFRVAGKQIKLFLIGFIRPAYKMYIESKIKERNIEQYVTLAEKVTFSNLPSVSRKCHIGLAMYTKTDVMNATLGTASNKIYEYTATGLPFIYFANPHFESYLKNMPWAIGTDLSFTSMENAIQKIVERYEELSQLAKSSFRERYNYENAMDAIWPALEEGLIIHKTGKN